MFDINYVDIENVSVGTNQSAQLNWNKYALQISCTNYSNKLHTS
jgi:hypothetical protein